MYRPIMRSLLLFITITLAASAQPGGLKRQSDVPMGKCAHDRDDVCCLTDRRKKSAHMLASNTRTDTATVLRKMDSLRAMFHAASHFPASTSRTATLAYVVPMACQSTAPTRHLTYFAITLVYRWRENCMSAAESLQLLGLLWFGDVSEV